MGPFVQGIGSFLLLCLASWCVGEGGEILGKKYDASIIGGLVIAWLNTAPETIFFITALDSNNPNFAVGAVSGSTIVVCTVALGACLYIGAQASKKPISLQPAVKKQCYILMLSLVVPLAISFVGFNLFLGAAGVIYYLGFLYISISKSSKSEPSSDHKDFDLEAGKLGDDEDSDEEEDEEEESTVKGALYLLAGGILIILFSSPFINSIVEISKVWRVSPSLLAFFLAPIASEAPEILESISLSRKGNIQSINIAYSNLVGGTITKTTLLCGIFCFYGYFKEFIWDSPSYSISLMLLSACAAMAASIGNFVVIQKRSHGVILWVTFVIAGMIQYYFNAGGGLASFEILDGNIVLNNFGVSQGVSRV